MPIAGGVWQALIRGRRLGCEVVQLFLKNNMQWALRPYSARTIARFNHERQQSQLEHVFAHAGYLINLAGPASPKRDRSIKLLIWEIQLAAALKLPFIVLHPGAHLGAGEAVGLDRAVAGLNEAVRATRHLQVCIALENTAGQGTCIGYKLEHLAHIFQRVEQPERFALCLDTAHLFAAGYDIRTPKGWAGVLKQIGALVGLRYVLAFHLNDSKAGLGSRIDRHEHIGRGKIGKPSFYFIVNDPQFINHPGCIETPKSKDFHEDIQNLAILRALALQKHSLGAAG